MRVVIRTTLPSSVIPKGVVMTACGITSNGKVSIVTTLGFQRDHGFSTTTNHDEVIKWKHFPRYWPFVRGIHRSPVNSPHKGQWRGALMFSLIYAWRNGWVNNRDAGDWRRHRAHYDVTVMPSVTKPRRTRVLAFISHWDVSWASLVGVWWLSSIIYDGLETKGPCFNGQSSTIFNECKAMREIRNEMVIHLSSHLRNQIVNEICSIFSHVIHDFENDTQIKVTAHNTLAIPSRVNLWTA